VIQANPLRVALTSLGCKVNFAEMAELAGRLAAAGCEVVPEDGPADVRVLNSCTVTSQADATTRQRLRRLRALDPGSRIVLTGCSVDTNIDRYLPRTASGERRAAPGLDAVFTNARKEEVADHVIGLARERAGRPSAAPSLRARAFIKVQDGCDHRCTYCIVWRARGASASVPAEQVVARVRAAAERGQREVVLTGVDLGSYGRDLGTSLAALVERVLSVSREQVRVRLSSVNANDVSPELVALNAHPSLCSHWHMPLQSGSDRILRAMHRGYRRAQYLRVARELREREPDTELTTDVMVAFPGETAGDHRETLELIDEVGFLSCHVFRWSPRPETPASDLGGRVDDREARRRSAEVRRAAASSGELSRRRAVGRVHDVVWDRVEDGLAHGLTATYHGVRARASRRTRPGSISRVLATGVDGERLRGRVLRS
jgi:threonylcarbamoyladenosine tRNA methylthiotransferase MtaB